MSVGPQGNGAAGGRELVGVAHEVDHHLLHLAEVDLASAIDGLLALAVSALIVVPVVLRIRGPAEKDPARRAWMKFLKLLENAGFGASLALGPMEVAHEASLALPEHRNIIGRIAVLYSRCRYSPSPPPVSQLERAVGAFKSKKAASGKIGSSR